MSKISRRDVLKVGAGTAAAGVAMSMGPVVARANDREKAGIQIHAAFPVTPGDDIKVSVTVHGLRHDLSGSGWDFETALAGQTPSFGACYFWQEGRIRRGKVFLAGTVLFANDPTSLDVPITTVANLSTGVVVWTFGSFEFRGPGTVVRFGGGD